MTTFFGLIWLLRRDGVSLGLPVAYLFMLLLIHVPGAFAHVVGSAVLQDSEFTAIGIFFTAIASVCFLAGVWLACVPSLPLHIEQPIDRHRFNLFALAAGWFFTYGLGPLRRVPSLGAAIDKAGGIWMLGVLLGLRDAVGRKDWKRLALWITALAVYPILTLLFGGFMSYGSVAIIIVVSALAISTKSYWRVVAGTVVAAFLGFHVFLSYFEHRDEIRAAVWQGGTLEERIEASTSMITDFRLFSSSDERQLTSLDERLNQNYFAGLAAVRIEHGQVDYLHGRSIWEGLIALVPRAIWPDKPVVAGSPKVVSEMTGLILSDTTSFGVGNVMEFQINFGIPGIIGGFLILGWAIGTMDRKAAAAERNGDMGLTIMYFLPGVGLTNPGGSIVEIASGTAAAYLGALGWRWAWSQWSQRQSPVPRLPSVARRRP